VTFVIMSPCIGIKDGTCVDVCPVDATRYIDDVPDEEKTYIKKNEELFSKP